MRVPRLLFFAFFGFIATSWSQQYMISTVTGGAPPPTPGAALTVPIGQSQDVATDAADNVYFTSSNCVFKLDASGTLNRIAGNGKPGYAGDGGLATSAALSAPRGIALDAAGNLFIADSGNNRIRKVSANGIIVTVAGDGVAGFAGDGGTAVLAELSSPLAVAVDGAGDVYIADSLNNRIREFSAAGIISTIAGTGVAGFAGNGGQAVAAQLNYPNGVAVDGSGNVLIADTNNAIIRKISASGTIATVAIGGTPGSPGPDGNICILPYPVQACGPTGVAVDGFGDVFFADTFNDRVTEVATNGTMAEFAGNLAKPWGVAVDGSGNVYVVNDSNYVYRSTQAGVVTTVAGNGSSAQLSLAIWLATDGSGDLFIADGSRVREFLANGTINTVNTSAVDVTSLAVDAAGNLYIASGATVQKVSTSGVVTTVVANDGTTGPAAIAVDGLGNLFIMDNTHFRVIKVSSSGVITTVAGTGAPGFSGDGGLAVNATMYGPFSIAADSAGDLFIGDNYRVREVTPNGIINTIAGNGGQSFTGNIGDGGLAVNAQLFPNGLAVDGLGNLFIAVEGSNSVRKVSTNGIITTVAGNGIAGYSGDGGPGTSAQLNAPYALAADGSGNVYVADYNNAVRKLTPTGQTVLISAVLDAASESAVPISPGKIVAIYGAGLGPAVGVAASPAFGFFGTQLAGTTVAVNNVLAPVYYASATQVDAIVPYGVSGSGATANITVAYQGGVSAAFAVPVAASSPGLFSYNASGAGQAAAVNVVDGTLNTAANPVKVGGYISLYATGEGQTSPLGVNGELATTPLPSPVLPVTATVGGLPAVVQYKGAVPGEVAGLMQVNVLIPAGVTPGGYVPVVLTVGSVATVNGAAWIAVSD